jgi:hypothetical protein
MGLVVEPLSLWQVPGWRTSLLGCQNKERVDMPCRTHSIRFSSSRCHFANFADFRIRLEKSRQRLVPTCKSRRQIRASPWSGPWLTMATTTLSAVPPLMQLDPKHQTAMKALVSTVIRSFYESRHYILVELLLKHHMCGCLDIEH